MQAHNDEAFSEIPRSGSDEGATIEKQKINVSPEPVVVAKPTEQNSSVKAADNDNSLSVKVKVQAGPPAVTRELYKFKLNKPAVPPKPAKKPRQSRKNTKCNNQKETQTSMKKDTNITTPEPVDDVNKDNSPLLPSSCTEEVKKPLLEANLKSNEQENICDEPVPDQIPAETIPTEVVFEFLDASSGKAIPYNEVITHLLPSPADSVHNNNPHSQEQHLPSSDSSTLNIAPTGNNGSLKESEDDNPRTDEPSETPEGIGTDEPSETPEDIGTDDVTNTEDDNIVTVASSQEYTIANDIENNIISSESFSDKVQSGQEETKENPLTVKVISDELSCVVKDDIKSINLELSCKDTRNKPNPEDSHIKSSPSPNITPSNPHQKICMNDEFTTNPEKPDRPKRNRKKTQAALAMEKEEIEAKARSAVRANRGHSRNINHTNEELTQRPSRKKKRTSV